ncbi:DBH-like monooxygenase protein 2 homolog [Halichondria panicea]|uniref:DBH-like monooxygenase protein 2 homolog n=1 Tax=Halichondria panicea TaxID=6063 RepID=UPI00312BA03C
MKGLLLLALLVHCAYGAHDLNEEYRFSADLSPSYKLHWSFDLQAGTIAFAVNVSTTGWVGFGLSPNGQMPGSDVIIGWVDQTGAVQFKDRYATGRFLPPVDLSQDWFLVSGEEENGYTILEFTRNLTSCDMNDLNIEADTARVIWSYRSSDPTSESDIRGHEVAGSTSLNLLGGLPQERVEPNSADFTILTSNVTIPAVDTTYWCVVSEIPSEVREQERYVYKISPEISANSSAYVHHIIIYLCNELNNTFLGDSSVCEDTHIDIRSCRGSEIIAGWAVGGEDFVFPPGVALPIGGENSRRYIVIEMHYDNPDLQTGVVDNSGIRFTYSSNRPEHEAGTLALGGPIDPHLIIPPGTPDFTINAFCSRECTQAHLPSEGIQVFGNLLHTHLAGHGLVVDHFRDAECGLLEQLEPIDENRRYDFNYQQYTILPKTVTVLPGDELKLSCFYGTSDKSQVTLGGESTRDEMCFSFLYYYPKTELDYCGSLPVADAYEEFARQYVNSSMHSDLFFSLLIGNHDVARPILNTVEWSQEAIDALQRIYLESPQGSYCSNGSGFIFTNNDDIPNADQCPYVSPDICTGEPGSQGRCCSQLGSGSTTLSQLSTLAVLFIVLSISLL